MKLRQFLQIVPAGFRLSAAIVVGLGALIGLVVGHNTANPEAFLQGMCVSGAIGLGLGIFTAIWLVCLGFVFADARRRNMRAVLWFLVAALFPHLLGFLLYFVMRSPIAVTCMQCGMTLPQQQRYCSWCGTPQTASDSTHGPLAASASQGVS